MATKPRGMAPMYAKMMEDPIRQARIRDAAAAEGQNNMAVSQMNRVLGQEMAGEQKRLAEMDKVGYELATRKDDLAFARKKHEFQKERFGVQMQQETADRVRREKQANARLESETGNEGLEMGLGLLSLGANLYGGYKEKQRHAEHMQALRQLSLSQLGIKYEDDKGGMEDEDPRPLDLTSGFESETYWSRRS